MEASNPKRIACASVTPLETGYLLKCLNEEQTHRSTHTHAGHQDEQRVKETEPCPRSAGESLFMVGESLFMTSGVRREARGGGMRQNSSFGSRRLAEVL